MQNKNKKLIRMKGKAAGEFSAESTREYRLALCVSIRQAAVFVAWRRGAALPGELERGDFRVRSQHSCVHV